MYSPRVEQSIDENFSMTNRRRYDLGKVREMRDRLKSEALQHI